MRLFIIPLLLTLARPAIAWGAAGHEIVATIAQVHLHPDVKEVIKGILPPQAEGRLASVAAWADGVRGRYRETGPMHYVNPIDDLPGDHCSFGEHGWTNDKVNVITAIDNMTRVLMDPHRTVAQKDIALRFLVHFVGDMHQPLHLTGRMRGGNDGKWCRVITSKECSRCILTAIFSFEGRRRSLHSVWDSGILTKNIRELSNYTRPTRSKQLESALVGAIFDPYVRFIVTEGIWGWWRNASTGEWLACPAAGDPYPHNPPNRLAKALEWVKAGLPKPLVALVEWAVEDPDVEGFDDATVELSQMALNGEPDDDFPACPYTWAKAIHPINCAYAWPAGWDPRAPLVELDTKEYLGRLGEDKVVEGLLAKGGIRLAAVLNGIFLDKGVGAWRE